MKIFKPRGVVLLDVAAASAIMVLVALTLTGLFVTTLQVMECAQAVTRGRLVAQSHLELARAGLAPELHVEHGLTSELTFVEVNGVIYWQIEVRGTALLKPLRLVASQ